MMRHISNSPTNFINVDSRASSLKRSRKELLTLNEITLTNQKEKVVPIITMRSSNIGAENEDYEEEEPIRFRFDFSEFYDLST